MASWTLRPTPVVAGLGPALAAEEGVVIRPPRLHHPPLQGGKMLSISTSLPLPETRPEKDDHDALCQIHKAAEEVAAVTTTATTATTTATAPVDAHHDALQAVDRVDLVAVAAAAAVAAETPAATTGSLRLKVVDDETAGLKPHRRRTKMMMTSLILTACSVRSVVRRRLLWIFLGA